MALQAFQLMCTFNAVFPEFSEDETAYYVQHNLTRHLNVPVIVSRVDDSDPSLGYSVTVGDQDPVIFSSGGIGVDPGGQVYLFADLNDVVGQEHPIVGQGVLNSDKH